MNIREMRKQLGYTQTEFSQRYNIPFRTIQNWEAGVRVPPQYILDFLHDRIVSDLVNRKAYSIPKYDRKKIDLPKRSEYDSVMSWLRAIKEKINEPFIFALDEALMCQGSFSGRSDEPVVWMYGDDSLSRYNGVVVLGNKVSSCSVQEINGLRCTDFNRTLADSLANEDILDMQGITEALSRYYRYNGSFIGLCPVPEYQAQFEVLADLAIKYYKN